MYVEGAGRQRLGFFEIVNLHLARYRVIGEYLRAASLPKNGKAKPMIISSETVTPNILAAIQSALDMSAHVLANDGTADTYTAIHLAVWSSLTDEQKYLVEKIETLCGAVKALSHAAHLGRLSHYQRSKLVRFSGN